MNPSCTVRLLVGAIAVALASLVPAAARAQPPTLNPGDRHRFIGADAEAETSSNCGFINGCGVDYGDLGADSPRMYVGSAVNVGAGGTTRFATGRLANFFTVAPGSENRIGAKLIGVVTWRGWLQADIGAYDNTSSIDIRVSIHNLPDRANPADRRLVASQTLNTNSVGGTISVPPIPNFERDIGRGGFALAVDLERGKDYMVAVEATCTSTSGLVGLFTASSFANFDVGGPGILDGFVEQTSMTITLEPDYLALIDELRQRFESHTHTYLTGRGEGHNNTEAVTSGPSEAPEARPPDAGIAAGRGRMPSLEVATVAPDRVRLVARVPSGSEAPLVERRRGDTDWEPMAAVTSGGVWEDVNVIAGMRYGYRLRSVRSGAESLSEEVWIDVPTLLFLGVEGARPNPITRDLTVGFTLPANEPAMLTLYDVQGRVVLTREVGGMGRGRHLFHWPSEIQLASGIYLLQLTQGGRSITSKVAVLR